MSKIQCFKTKIDGVSEIKRIKFTLPYPHKLVTLKEMYKLFWKDDIYEMFRFEHDDVLKKPKSYDNYRLPVNLDFHSKDTPLLYKHIVAEQILLSGINSDSYNEFFDNYSGTAFDLITLMMNPLKWVDNSHCSKNMIVDGRIAIEERDHSRYGNVQDIVDERIRKNALDFADNYVVCAEDIPEHGCIKGLHYWEEITWNISTLYDKALNGSYVTDSDFANTRSYDAPTLRNNLMIIAEYRGGKRASEILCDLKSEWTTIKAWKVEFDNMKDKDVQQFEDTLMHGFDDLLEQWKNESQPTKSASDNQSFESLLQCPANDKERVMARLRELLDGKGGQQVALILAAAMFKYHYIISMPTERQYASEFQLKGVWRSVTDYLKNHTLPNGKLNVSIDHIEI
jgi:hypothetical protein